MTQHVNSIFLGMNVSLHRKGSGGGHAEVPDPSPTPVLASLRTVLPLLSSFMTASSLEPTVLHFLRFRLRALFPKSKCCIPKHEGCAPEKKRGSALVQTGNCGRSTSDLKARFHEDLNGSFLGSSGFAMVCKNGSVLTISFRKSLGVGCVECQRVQTIQHEKNCQDAHGLNMVETCFTVVLTCVSIFPKKKGSRMLQRLSMVQEGLKISQRVTRDAMAPQEGVKVESKINQRRQGFFIRRTNERKSMKNCSKKKKHPSYHSVIGPL